MKLLTIKFLNAYLWNDHTNEMKSLPWAIYVMIWASVHHGLPPKQIETWISQNPKIMFFFDEISQHFVSTFVRGKGKPFCTERPPLSGLKATQGVYGEKIVKNSGLL